MKARVGSFTLAAAATALCACSAFGPDRHAPQLPLPAHYPAEATPARRLAADGSVQVLAYGARPVPEWWRAYGSDALDRLVTEGLRNSPSLAAARSTLQAAREQLRGQIGSSLLPSVDLGFSPERERSLGIPILPQTPTFLYDVFAAEVQTSYTFDFFGAAMLADRALAGSIRQQALQLEATRRALAANIVTAAIDAAALQEEIAATERQVALGERNARQVTARYELGSASRDQMLAAQQDAADEAAALPPLRTQALTLRHALAVLLGRTPDRAPVPPAFESLQLPGTVPVSVASDLLHQRPDILAAEAAVRAAADAAGAATAAMFPSLTLSAGYGRGGFDWSTFTSPAGAIWSVGASLTQPLFHGGALVARKRQYQATYEASVSLYKQTVLSAFQNVADTLAALEQDADALSQASRAATAAREAHEDADSRYALGAVPFDAALAAGEQFQVARIQYIRARASRLTDTAALFVAMGDPAAGMTAGKSR